MTKKLIRSVKLQTLSDAQIIKRYLDHPQDEELYFLTLEIELRGARKKLRIPGTLFSTTFFIFFFSACF